MSTILTMSSAPFTVRTSRPILSMAIDKYRGFARMAPAQVNRFRVTLRPRSIVFLPACPCPPLRGAIVTAVVLGAAHLNTALGLLV